MKIKEIPHGLDLAVSGPKRSKGLHMSDIYGAYYAKYDKRFRDNGTGPDKVRMEEGLAFEEILEPALAARHFGTRPKEQRLRLNSSGEITKKGPVDLFFSPDYIFVIDDETVLGEFKYTRYSSKDAPRGKKFAKWITQMKLYGYALNINVARLFVLFINGTYKPMNPQLKAWEIRFTDDELAEEWEIMMRFAKEEGLLSAKG